MAAKKFPPPLSPEEIEQILRIAILHGRPIHGDKVLSVKQPYAALIVAQFKPFENRTWKTDYRGLIWIHASKPVPREFDWQSHAILNLGLSERDCDSITDTVETTGAIIGCVWLGCIYPKELLPREHTGNVHAEGPFCWHFTAADELDTPIPYKGKLQLFEYR